MFCYTFTKVCFNYKIKYTAYYELKYKNIKYKINDLNHN